MILNYFPHSVWATEDDLKHLRDKFYQPILEMINLHMAKVDNRQFVSVFQGMSLCGAKIFSEKYLNMFLNAYVKRIQTKSLSQEEVYQFLELLIQYLKLNRGLMEKIDSSQLMRLSCDLYLSDQLPSMSCTKLSGLYWLCCNLGPYWDPATIQKAENRLIELLRIEIATQKKFDGDYDADIPEGLQTM